MSEYNNMTHNTSRNQCCWLHVNIMFSQQSLNNNHTWLMFNVYYPPYLGLWCRHRSQHQYHHCRHEQCSSLSSSRSSCHCLHHNAIDNIMKSGSSSISERRWQWAANLHILPSTHIATQHYHSSLYQIWLLCIVAVVAVSLSGLPLRLASCSPLIVLIGSLSRRSPNCF